MKREDPARGNISGRGWRSMLEKKDTHSVPPAIEGIGYTFREHGHLHALYNTVVLTFQVMSMPY